MNPTCRSGDHRFGASSVDWTTRTTLHQRSTAADPREQRSARHRARGEQRRLTRALLDFAGAAAPAAYAPAVAGVTAVGDPHSDRAGAAAAEAATVTVARRTS